MARFVMVTTLGDPGYGNRYACECQHHSGSNLNPYAASNEQLNSYAEPVVTHWAVAFFTAQGFANVFLLGATDAGPFPATRGLSISRIGCRSDWNTLCLRPANNTSAGNGTTLGSAEDNLADLTAATSIHLFGRCRFCGGGIACVAFCRPAIHTACNFIPSDCLLNSHLNPAEIPPTSWTGVDNAAAGIQNHASIDSRLETGRVTIGCTTSRRVVFIEVEDRSRRPRDPQRSSTLIASC